MTGRIFVLEDDKGWEAYYRRVLKDYDLKFFNNGIEAVAAMDDEKPALVLLDVLLAGPTGFAVVHEMRSYPELENVPIIVVSSVKMHEIDEKYGILKSFDKSEMMPRDLIDAVAGAMEVCCG